LQIRYFFISTSTNLKVFGMESESEEDISDEQARKIALAELDEEEIEFEIKAKRMRDALDRWEEEINESKIEDQRRMRELDRIKDALEATKVCVS
jgi:hypothetical protein